MHHENLSEYLISMYSQIITLETSVLCQEDIRQQVSKRQPCSAGRGGLHPSSLVMSYKADSFRRNKCTDNDYNCLNI